MKKDDTENSVASHGSLGFQPVSWVWNRSEGTNDYLSPICIDRCRQIDGSVKYAVRQSGACLNRFGEWEYEPIPSSRDDEFFNRCRFERWEDAAVCIETHCKPLGTFAR